MSNTPDYSANDPKGWCGDPKRGAAMGRFPRKGDPDFSGRLFLRQVRLDSGGYDRNGTYFGGGLGVPQLYWYASEDGEIDRTLRATSRENARAQVLSEYPNAKVRR